ncbi:MAG: hypothetical protein IJY09_11310 [Lachnospiraceae bacterium]|nr:hypothetical protein [Lachnospiraceae bacterium]
MFKKKLTRFTTLLLSAALLTACGGKEDTPTPTPAQDIQTPDATPTPEGSSGSEASPSETTPAPTQAADANEIPTTGTFVSTVPGEEWSYGQVAVGGGGFVTGVFATCEENVYYSRTDVGGAYRWDESAQAWKSLNYWVSEADVGYLGIHGLAVDPNNAANVYLLAGTEYFSDGRTALLKSSDYGETFTVVDLSNMIRVHGNAMGRGNGERIAVDPNNSNILFAGGRTGGMIKSTDGGLTWSSVSFPVTTTANGSGIHIIVFDPNSAEGGASQRIYAAVSQKDTTEGNLFVSEDGGNTWNTLANAYNKAMPQRIKLDSAGNLYVVYASAEGPWNATSGAVYKYDAATKEATSIAPSTRAFGDLVIDPTNENRMLLVTTQNWNKQPNGAFGDNFFVTTDGGQTWTNIIEKITMSTNDMPWIADCAIHWCCSLAINPFNPNEIQVTSGNGIFACDNIWDAAPAFYFQSRGIEETVPMDIITLPDYPLVSAALDYDGFVHEDIYTPAERHADKIGSTTSITIAAQNRNYWAKVGGSSDAMALTYSTDGGKSWAKITNSPEEGKTFYNGCIAFNADGSRLFWNPEGSIRIYYTEDFGKTWAQCDGAKGQNMYIIGDSVNPNYVYAYGNNKLFVSADGGKTFDKAGGSLLLAEDRLCVSPTEEGTLYVPSGAKLYKMTDYGETAVEIPGITSCKCVGLGKAKNDGDPYVIYIYGKVEGSGATAIYMTEDNGATWVRVTDEAHQFGGMGNGDLISGDLNVYGRCYMTTVGLGIAYCDKIEK